MTGYSEFEYYLISFLNVAPYIGLFLYAFRNSFRFSIGRTAAVIAVVTASCVGSNAFVKDAPTLLQQLYSYIIFAVLVVTAVVIIKAKAGRMLFLAIMLKNCADFIVVFSKYLEHLFWPEGALVIYHFTYAIMMVICELCLLSIVFVIIRRHFTCDSIGAVYSKSWRFLWLIPLFFYYSWIHIYYSDGLSSLELALRLDSSIYLLFSIICQLMIYTCIAVMMERTEENMIMQEQIHAKELQMLQYRNITLKIEKAGTMRHDLRHHLITISSLLKSGQLDKLGEYLDEQVAVSDTSSSIRYCSNEVVNIILVYFGDKCREAGISYDVDVDIPQKTVLSDSEISVLFGNILENAYEACKRQDNNDDEAAVIRVRGRIISGKLAISVENSIPNEYVFHDVPLIASSKRNDYGIGTRSCRDIVQSHGGSIDFVCDDTFIAEILLPGV